MRKESISPTGQLEIFKVYDNGNEELHFSENNVITSGMGFGLSFLFSGRGSQTVTDYQIRWFQVGTAGSNVMDTYDQTWQSLETPLEKAEYETGFYKLVMDNHKLRKHETTVSGDFAHIPFHAIQKTGDTSVKYTLVLDKYSCNEQTLNEVGLFMHNPEGADAVTSVLCAYRPFTNILKTNDFSLVFKWTLNF